VCDIQEPVSKYICTISSPFKLWGPGSVHNSSAYTNGLDGVVRGYPSEASTFYNLHVLVSLNGLMSTCASLH